MKYKVIKYGTMSTLTILTLLLHTQIWEYCSGVVHSFSYILCFGFTFLSFVFFFLVDLTNKVKKGAKYNFGTLVFLGFFIIAFTLSSKINNKFWTEKSLQSEVEIKNRAVTHLLLYKNRAFKIRLYSKDDVCIYEGSYSLKDNLLTLHRKNIEQVTNKTITQKYRIKPSDSLLLPEDKAYNKMKVTHLDQ